MPAGERAVPGAMKELDEVGRRRARRTLFTALAISEEDE